MDPSALESDENVFYMFGVIHREMGNSALIYDWLSRIEPGVVTLEFSRYGLAFRKEKGPLYRERIDSLVTRMREDGEEIGEDSLFHLRAFIDLPEEYEAALRYTEEHNALLCLVDMDYYSRLKLKEAEELFSEENIRKSAHAQDANRRGNEKVIAKLCIESDLPIKVYTEEMLIRDRYMSDRISVLRKHHRGRVFTHITGWQHLKDPYGVFAQFHPIKVFPYD